jgi:hypothetical protein
MNQPVGVLALRIWRTEDGDIRARVTAMLDVANPAPANISYYASTDELEAAVASWVERFSARRRSRWAGREDRLPTGPQDKP